MMKLPELPQDFTRSLGKLMQEMIRAYGQACASAALERAAEVCKYQELEEYWTDPIAAIHACIDDIRAEIASEGNWGTSFAAMPEFIAEQKAKHIPHLPAVA
jgi:hypothetical protein